MTAVLHGSSLASTAAATAASIAPVDPSTPAAAFDIGAAYSEAVALHQGRRLSEAEEIYRRILEAKPNHAGALHLLGVVDLQRGLAASALERIGKAIELNPRAAVFHGNYATALQATGRTADAEKHYREATRLDPNYADAHNNLAALIEKRGRAAEAIQSYLAAVKAKPGFAIAHFNLAQLLRQQGRYDEAIEHYGKAVAADPNHAEAHRGLGIALGRRNRVDDSIAALKRAIALNPRDSEAFNHLGNRFKTKGQLAEAEGAYRQALTISPRYVDAWNNLGNVFYRRGQLDAAEESYRKALEINPSYPDGHGNLGIVHMGRCRYDDAMASLRQAIRLRPSYPEARCNLSQALLVRGDFAAGWPLYEARWNLALMKPRPFRQPLWGGEALAGRTILLHVEQGLGDAIQFARYAPIVKALGADVILELPRELTRLFAPMSRQGIRLVARGTSLPHFDVHCPLLSVPGALGVDLGTIAAPVPYLEAEPPLLEKWRARFAAEPGLKVGLVWAGNPQHGNDLNRSFRPLAMKPLFAVPGVRFYSLQKQQRPSDREDLGQLGPIEDLASELGDFADSAAILGALDLLIAADTSVVHLAGALARPVWTMVPFSPDWRWLLERQDSPWYPTMRLFRQPRLREWGAVMQDVARDLADLARPTGG